MMLDALRSERLTLAAMSRRRTPRAVSQAQEDPGVMARKVQPARLISCHILENNC
jgi:hypothetical protein